MTKNIATKHRATADQGSGAGGATVAPGGADAERTPLL
jgi:hypothetical protein